MNLGTPDLWQFTALHGHGAPWVPLAGTKSSANSGQPTV